MDHLSRDWHYSLIGSLFKNFKVTTISILFYPWIFAKIDQSLNGFIRIFPFIFSSLVYFNTIFNSFEVCTNGLGYNPDFKDHTKTPFQEDCLGNDTHNCQHMNTEDLERVKENAFKMTSWFVLSVILFVTQIFQLFTYVARTRAHNDIRGNMRNDIFKCCCLFPLMLVQLASEHEIYSF